MKKITETNLKCRGTFQGNTRETGTTVPLKLQKGITLIALVITIIVLLILAGVTLSIVFNGGIINKSQTAVDKYSEESAKEKLSLAIFNYKMGVITGEAGEGQKTFTKYIEEIGGTATHNEGTYTVELDGYKFTVDDSKFEIKSNGATSGKTETPEESVTPEVTKYTITYNANGGTGSMTAGEKTEGTAYTIASNGFTGATGYVFKEWNTQADGKGTKYTENQSYNTEANLTLYAIWYKNVYNIGDTVTVGGESFYVLEDSDATKYTVTLIAEYNLNSEGTAQSNGTSSKFSSTSYWGDDFKGSPFNLNDLGKESTGDAIAKAKSYASSKGATSGRLLTYEEANALKIAILTDETGKISQMLWKQNYWLGSAGNTEAVFAARGSNKDLYNDYYYSSYGVRPVITVSKSLVS